MQPSLPLAMYAELAYRRERLQHDFRSRHQKVGGTRRIDDRDRTPSGEPRR